MPRNSQRAVIALTGAALFMVVLDNLIVASTLPSIQRTLHGSLSQLQWVLDAYILSFAVLMLTAAALGDRYGRRRVFVAGVLLFTGASAAGGLAPNAELLIAARAVQGVGGAIVMPLTLTLIGAAFPPERRGAALGAWSAIAGVGVALGPIAGGLLTEALSWHWIFWVNVPIGLAVAALAPAMLAESRGGREPLDPLGVALVSGGLLAAVWATVRANEIGWTSAGTLASYALGAALLAGFVAWQARATDPMIPLRLFRSAELRAANLASLLIAFAMFSSFVVLIQFLTDVRGEGPISSGLHTLFWTAMPMLVSPFAGRIGRRFDPARVVSAGLSLSALGLAVLAASVAAGTPALALAPGLLAVGTGVGLTLPSLAATGLAAVAAADMGRASGLLSTARQVGAVFGVAVGVAVFQAASHGSDAAAISAGVRATLIVSAAGAALGAALALTGRARPVTAVALEAAPAHRARI